MWLHFIASGVAPDASWGTLSSGVSTYCGPFPVLVACRGDIGETLAMTETFRMALPSNWNWSIGGGSRQESTEAQVLSAWGWEAGVRSQNDLDRLPSKAEPTRASKDKKDVA